MGPTEHLQKTDQMRQGSTEEFLGCTTLNNMTVLRRNILRVYIPVRAEESLRVSVKIQEQLQEQEVPLNNGLKKLTAYNSRIPGPRLLNENL